jgi:transcriptional regulator with XRE-family HTH domain
MSMAGRMVRYARRRAGLTQRALSAKAGIPQETIARIERGRVDPRVGTLDRLLEACEFGLEAMPRLGIGIDRPQIQERLDLSPSARIARAMREDQVMLEFRSNLKRVAE